MYRYFLFCHQLLDHVGNSSGCGNSSLLQLLNSCEMSLCVASAKLKLSIPQHSIIIGCFSSGLSNSALQRLLVTLGVPFHSFEQEVGYAYIKLENIFILG